MSFADHLYGIRAGLFQQEARKVSFSCVANEKRIEGELSSWQTVSTSRSVAANNEVFVVSTGRSVRDQR